VGPLQASALGPVQTAAPKVPGPSDLPMYSQGWRPRNSVISSPVPVPGARRRPGPGGRRTTPGRRGARPRGRPRTALAAESAPGNRPASSLRRPRPRPRPAGPAVSWGRLGTRSMRTVRTPSHRSTACRIPGSAANAPPAARISADAASATWRPTRRRLPGRRIARRAATLGASSGVAGNASSRARLRRSLSMSLNGLPLRARSGAAPARARAST
jgi:hypothetical protein